MGNPALKQLICPSMQENGKSCTRAASAVASLAKLIASLAVLDESSPVFCTGVLLQARPQNNKAICGKCRTIHPQLAATLLLLTPARIGPRQFAPLAARRRKHKPALGIAKLSRSRQQHRAYVGARIAGIDGVDLAQELKFSR